MSIEVKRVAWPPPNPKAAIETTVETEVENTKSNSNETNLSSTLESNQQVSILIIYWLFKFHSMAG